MGVKDLHIQEWRQCDYELVIAELGECYNESQSQVKWSIDINSGKVCKMMDRSAQARPKHTLKDWPLNCHLRGMALDKSQIRPTSIMNKAFENELPAGDFAVKASLMVIKPPSTCNSLKIDIMDSHVDPDNEDKIEAWIWKSSCMAKCISPVQRG